MRKNKPRVVVMAPPCTAFNALQRLFKHLHPKSFRLAMKIGLRLANLSAAVALFQLKTHHEFICENPFTSKMWLLRCWEFILKQPGIEVSRIDQCMYGLRSPSGIPM